MSNIIKVIQCGLGAVGTRMVRIILERENLEVVGGIGHRNHIGKDIGEVVGLDRELGIKVCSNAGEVLRAVEGDVVLIATTRYLKEMFNTIKEALENGKNVITVGIEAAYPWTKSPDLAHQIDELAKKKNVTFLGTGMTPGFTMDYLPITFTGLMKKVEKITIRRIVDMAFCGPITWQQYGYGKKIEAFNRGLDRGKIEGFIVLKEIMDMTAKALGWEIDNYKETKKGLVSKSKRIAKSGVVEPETVCGLEQTAHGFRQGKEILTYNYALIITPNLEEDNIEAGHFISIEGEPKIEATLTCEDAYQATAALAVNSIPNVIKARPGIITVYELPPSPCFKV
ncbi:MAG: Gfo/Idh/MocA family oxidoreductase [Candidatus Hodarchaeota archaeon]